MAAHSKRKEERTDGFVSSKEAKTVLKLYCRPGAMLVPATAEAKVRASLDFKS